MRKIYLDNAATTPMDQRVLDAMLPYMQSHFGNPSSIHVFGRESKAAIERARKRVADCLNASMGEIFFTSGGTESNNMAIRCAIRDLGVQTVISSPIEHHCVESLLHKMESGGRIKLHMIQLKEDGHFDLDHLERLLEKTEGKVLVSLMHANNEIGNLSDLERIAEICEANEVYFHSDTVQTVGHYPFDLSKLKIDFMSGASHKFHGPKGVGFIYINSRDSVDPIILGGAQERNMRAGTENVYGIIGFAKALELATSEMDEHRAYIENLKFYMAEGLKALVPGVSFNGDWENGLYTVLNVNFPPSEKNDLLLFNLDINGIAASGGSACSSGSDLGSHVISQLNTVEGSTSIRFSFSKYNSREEIDFVLEKVGEILSLNSVRQEIQGY